MAAGDFITSYGKVLLYVSGNPSTRLRDVAAALDMTERTAFGLVRELTAAGYLVKQREGRRNHYVVRRGPPLAGQVEAEGLVRQLQALIAPVP